MFTLPVECILILSIISFCLGVEDQSLYKGKHAEGAFLKPRLSPPIVLTTWAFSDAAQAAWDVLSQANGTALDAVQEGCDYCQRMQCDFTVGYGGSPDETGETTLDAAIIDGDRLRVGAVGGLRRIKNAIGVARKVMLHTEHTILVGEAATEFAKQMGFPEETLTTNKSSQLWDTWKNNNCQPNFWKDVEPDSRESCGPYRERPSGTKARRKQGTPVPNVQLTTAYHHDTIGQIVMDSAGSMAAGLSSNGAIHKIPGRMGDAGVPGAGGHADSAVGAAAATGDGDVMMRFSPAALIVERMRNKVSPGKATYQLVKMMSEKYPSFKGAVIAFDREGRIGAACHGLPNFPFSLISASAPQVKTYYIKCLTSTLLP